MDWGTPEEIETRNRIMVAAASYAYEVEGDPIMSDRDFDTLCGRINLLTVTTNPAMDKWFRENFQPDTGMWVHKHPDPEGLTKVLRYIRG